MLSSRRQLVIHRLTESFPERTETADKKELTRAITNLVVNVYKHNPKGIKAKVAVEKKEDKVVIKILDTGAEIPQDMDIFEPFVTENTSRMSGRGTGLGLAITKRIIERNGGKIYISSSEEGYTKAFIIEL